MSSPGSSSGDGGDHTTPFLLRLFHRTGSFHRLDEFTGHSLPDHASVYTGMDCTLEELALALAGSHPSAIPTPAAGTRLVFQLVYPDLRNVNLSGHSPPRFDVKYLGSIVIGARTPGVELNAPDEAAALKDSEKTLGDFKFVVGDYISCAVLPPLPNGSVAPASSAKRETAPNVRDGWGGRRGDFPSRGGPARGGGRGGRQAWRDGTAENFPSGDWRRGERLPDGPRSRGRSRW